MTRPTPTEPHGILVVDKERGPTSHDVVAFARRALGTRAVGHTGTLDPMATGVLVVLVGEATKLSSYLGASDKSYAATVRLGQATDTLDAEGRVLDERPVPPLSTSEVARAATRFLGEIDQVAPLASAIKVGGQPLHRAQRQGKAIEAPVRRVRLDAITIDAVRVGEIDFSIRCGKGFYVRSLGRDLAEALGTVGHLSALRRTRNGPFSVVDAIPSRALQEARSIPERQREVRAALLPLQRAAEAFATLTLSQDGVTQARHGKPITKETVLAGAAARDDVLIARDELGELVAIVRPDDEGFRVVRGFRPLA